MKTHNSRNNPPRTPKPIFSRRRRRCFLLRAGRPLPPDGRPPPGGRPPEPGGRPDPGGPPEPGGRPAPLPPLRAAVVRARPDGGTAGRPAPEPRVAPPPPPVLRVRAGAGRRTEPARGPTAEVSSWGGTREFLFPDSWWATTGVPVRSLASLAVDAGEDLLRQRPAGAAVTEGPAVTA